MELSIVNHSVNITPWHTMWMLALGLFGTFKLLTWLMVPIRGASVWRQIGYLLAWPGMDPAAFLDRREVARSPDSREWVLAVGKSLCGLMAVGFAMRRPPILGPCGNGWLALFGITFILHFGLFHLLSCCWRRGGVQARPLMQWPIVSEGLGEFWGRRWNTAFRDLMLRFFFRRYGVRLGRQVSVVLAFLISGLIHEVVISYPAMGGFGGPTLYFLIQAGGVLIERSRFGGYLGLARGWRGRCFAMAMLLTPVSLLFHGPFMEQVIGSYFQDF